MGTLATYCMRYCWGGHAVSSYSQWSQTNVQQVSVEQLSAERLWGLLWGIMSAGETENLAGGAQLFLGFLSQPGSWGMGHSQALQLALKVVGSADFTAWCEKEQHEAASTAERCWWAVAFCVYHNSGFCVKHARDKFFGEMRTGQLHTHWAPLPSVNSRQAERCYSQNLPCTPSA